MNQDPNFMSWIVPQSKAQKEASLEQRVSDIRGAIEKALNHSPSMRSYFAGMDAQPDSPSFYVNDVYDTYAIVVRYGDGAACFFKVNYSVDPDGGIKVDSNLIPVEKTYKPVSQTDAEEKYLDDAMLEELMEVDEIEDDVEMEIGTKSKAEKPSLYDEYDKRESLKGGPGSGNFGHAGRLGKKGGSAPNKGGGGAGSGVAMGSGKTMLFKLE